MGENRSSVTTNPIQSNPIQSNPIQSNPIQSNPIQSNPILSPLIAAVPPVPREHSVLRVAPLAHFALQVHILAKDPRAALSANPENTHLTRPHRAKIVLLANTQRPPRLSARRARLGRTPSMAHLLAIHAQPAATPLDLQVNVQRVPQEHTALRALQLVSRAHLGR